MTRTFEANRVPRQPRAKEKRRAEGSPGARDLQIILALVRRRLSSDV
jgi:hypothetical protein